MNVALFVGGIALVLVVLFDALWTALWPEGGAGPLTDQVGGFAWSLAKRVASDDQKIDHHRLSAAGPMIMVLTVSTWLLLLWLGLILIFNSHPRAVVDATSYEPADLSSRIWFVLYAASTMGNGDFLPDTSFFKVLAGLSTNSAIALLTLAITYMIQVLSAVVEKRTFAAEVMSLGGSTAAIVDTLQRAQPSGIASQLTSIGARLAELAQQHKAYPVLHYFHPTDREHSAACAVASLDEAITVYTTGLEKEEAELSASTLLPVQRSIATFLRSLRDNYREPADENPPMPDTGELEERGVELARRETLEGQLEERAERRRLLMGLVDYNGWSWDDVLHGTDS